MLTEPVPVKHTLPFTTESVYICVDVDVCCDVTYLSSVISKSYYYILYDMKQSNTCSHISNLEKNIFKKKLLNRPVTPSRNSRFPYTCIYSN